MSSTTILPGFLLAVAGTFLFSLKPILIKFAYAEGLSSEQVIILRMLIALPIYIGVVVYQWRRKTHRREHYKHFFLPVLGLGVLGYFVASYLDLLGLQYISAQLERVVLFSFPTLVVLMSYMFFKTQLPKNIWLILVLSYMGILLIFGHDLTTLGSEVLLGTGLVFLSAIAFALYVLLSKPVMHKIGSQMFTAMAMISASFFIFVFFSLKPEKVEFVVSADAYLLVAVLAVFSTVIPSLLVAEAIQRIGPERTSIIGTCGPVITSGLAVLALGESFTLFHLAGLVLIIFSIALMLKKPNE